MTKATLYGSTASSVADLAAKSSAEHFGALDVVRCYYPGLPPSDAWAPARIPGAAAATSTPVVVSFKAQPADLLAGTYDTILESFLQGAPRARPTFLSYYHEPEDEIERGQFTLADYLAAWLYVVRIAEKVHNPHLHPTLILMGYDLLPHSGRTWQSYLPQGDIIRCLGWDTYPRGGTGTPDPVTFMGAVAAASASVALPFGYAEFGTVTAEGRPAWLKDCATYANSVGARFCSMYDSKFNGGLGGSGTFSVTDAASIAAWRAVVGATPGSTSE